MLRTVQTENGWVKGIEAADPRITAFKGIPFAAPPVGENRWRAPQPCEDWDEVKTYLDEASRAKNEAAELRRKLQNAQNQNNRR